MEEDVAARKSKRRTGLWRKLVERNGRDARTENEKRGEETSFWVVAERGG
jgi:hypothetical protein